MAKYYIIAGEASGDLHGAGLIKSLLRYDSAAVFRFWGGDGMQEAVPDGSRPVCHYRDCAVMGFRDVASNAGKLLGNLQFCKKDILEWNPDAVILVDYPGFNIRIAEFAHSHGFRTYWFIAPKTWASRERRNRKLAESVDRMFLILPFEEKYFKSKGIRCEYSGNPLVDTVLQSKAMSGSRQDFLAAGSLPERRYIALLAGSRKSEIEAMMPVYVEAAELIRNAAGEDIEFLLAGAPGRSADDYAGYIEGREHIHLIFNGTYSILRHSEAAVINSGTASLEAVLTGTPQVVGWTASKLAEFSAKHILRIQNRISFISLGNLIAGKSVFRELLFDDFNAAAVADEVIRLLNDSAYREEMLEGYCGITACLGDGGAYDRTAASISENLKHMI